MIALRHTLMCFFFWLQLYTPIPAVYLPGCWIYTKDIVCYIIFQEDDNARQGCTRARGDLGWIRGW